MSKRRPPDLTISIAIAAACAAWCVLPGTALAEPPPNLSVGSSQYTFDVTTGAAPGSSQGGVSFSNTGGLIDSCSASPDLPNGFVLRSSRVTSHPMGGGPETVTTNCQLYFYGPNSVALPQTSFTFTATGPGGQSSVNVSIEVKDYYPRLNPNEHTFKGPSFVEQSLNTVSLGEAVDILIPNSSTADRFTTITRCTINPPTPFTVIPYVDASNYRDRRIGCRIQGTVPNDFPLGNHAFQIEAINNKGPGGPVPLQITVILPADPVHFTSIPVSSADGSPVDITVRPGQMFELRWTNKSGDLTGRICEWSSSLPIWLSVVKRANECVVSGTVPKDETPRGIATDVGLSSPGRAKSFLPVNLYITGGGAAATGAAATGAAATGAAATGAAATGAAATGAAATGAAATGAAIHTLAFSKKGEGSLTSAACPASGASNVCPASISVSNGNSVTLTATPAQGFVFIWWEGDCTSARTSANCTLTMNANKSVSAVFRPVIANVKLGTCANNNVGFHLKLGAWSGNSWHACFEYATNSSTTAVTDVKTANSSVQCETGWDRVGGVALCVKRESLGQGSSVRRFVTGAESGPSCAPGSVPTGSPAGILAQNRGKTKNGNVLCLRKE